ncbi:BlaI/MecI/CopY family transcriptional regulator [Microlunatus elymi]|uniref:BlaI/MecI/CopY family transcriptional regulator n=1 Tax=Microlunatus elymi TaxID=2596828 RepID=UPI001AEFF14E|nr:BlaI/MecI/CopY family transcriptional regulator [Microlunatus elymi]
MTRDRGQLEADVMRLLWDADAPRTAKELQAGFEGSAPAVTTVLTVLDRLRRKGLVTRSDAKTNITFTATRSESDHAVENMLQSLETTGDRQAVLLRFAGDLDRADAELLRRALEGRDRRRTRPGSRADSSGGVKDRG